MTYADGKIYVIKNTENELLYIGSTVQTLKERLRLHKKDCRSKKTKLYVAMCDIGEDKFYIELIENYPCNSKKELTFRESHFITYYGSCNKGYNTNVSKEFNQKRVKYQKDYYKENKVSICLKNKIYREENSDKVKQQKKEHREANRDRILAKKNEKVACGCGVLSSRDNLARHKRSYHHRLWEEQQAKEVEEVKEEV